MDFPKISIDFPRQSSTSLGCTLNLAKTLLVVFVIAVALGHTEVADAKEVGVLALWRRHISKVTWGIYQETYCMGSKYGLGLGSSHYSWNSVVLAIMYVYIYIYIRSPCEFRQRVGARTL